MAKSGCGQLFHRLQELLPFRGIICILYDCPRDNIGLDALKTAEYESLESPNIDQALDVVECRHGIHVQPLQMSKPATTETINAFNSVVRRYVKLEQLFTMHQRRYVSDATGMYRQSPQCRAFSKTIQSRK